MSRVSSRVKRKFCRLHGWAPHVVGMRIVAIDRATATITVSSKTTCCRCNGVPGMTRTEKIKAFLRGFKLPRSVKARTFVGARFSE